MIISGRFDVKLDPMDFSVQGRGGVTLGRMSIDKIFYGELDAKSRGEMISAMTMTEGSAGYVAIEQVSGQLSGKDGSFVLQHYGSMSRGKDTLILEVVPDSASEELVGLSGKMVIRVEGGEHFYDFDYELDSK